MKFNNKNNTIMAKSTMNQDELRDFLNAHNMTKKRLGELIGQPDTVLSSAFNHFVVNGKPLYFSAERLARINEALPVMADEITARLMHFSGDGRFDKACAEQLRAVGDYFNLTKFTKRLLGWSKSKKDAVLSPVHPGYGHVKKTDVTAINTELLAVAGVLREMKIVPMEGASTL